MPHNFDTERSSVHTRQAATQRTRNVRTLSTMKPLKFIAHPRMPAFSGSDEYWKNRYLSGRNSGAGSYGRLAEFKASILNEFVASNSIRSVLEFGCGDGNQLLSAQYPRYHGFDISPTAISLCEQRFQHDVSKTFSVLRSNSGYRADLVLSLDVVYHLVEDSVFESHISDLFESAKQFVCIYSTNSARRSLVRSPHVRHRNFSGYVALSQPHFELVRVVRNPYPERFRRIGSTSNADFFFYKRTNQL